MSLQMKMWNRAGVAMLAVGSTGIVDAAPVADRAIAGLLLAQTASEGGEGGEAGGLLPSQYRLMLSAERDPIYDGAGIASAYVEQVHAAYQRSTRSARQLQSSITQLLEHTDETTLAAARTRWIEARRDYLVTEAFRFYEGPVDAPERDGFPAGPESRINAWPLNEAVIDSVAGDADAGLVNAFDVPLTRETIIARDQTSDEVTSPPLACHRVSALGSGSIRRRTWSATVSGFRRRHCVERPSPHLPGFARSAAGRRSGFARQSVESRARGQLRADVARAAAA